MSFLNQNFDKELQRMAELAGIPKSYLNENISEVKSESSTNPVVINLKETKLPLIKEVEDIYDDLDDIFDVEEYESKTSSGELDKDLKTAMVLNNVSQREATMLDLYTKYNPKTLGATPEREGGTLGTIFSKEPVQKVPGASKEIDRLTWMKKAGLEQDMIDKLKDSGMSDEEIKNVVSAEMSKRKRAPVTFGEEPAMKNQVSDKTSQAKWQPTLKNASIIATESKDGKLSDKGKQQLEFLSRMLSKRPLSPSVDGNENINIEQALFDTIYKDLVVANAEHIVRDFYKNALIPIISRLLKRNTPSPQDAQFDTLLRAGLNKSIDATKAGKYNKSGAFQNFGAWFMQVAKNQIIDELKKITDFKLDTEHIYSWLEGMSGPLKVESKLNPKEANGHYDKNVLVSQNSFIENGEKKPYYLYIYNNPIDAFGDFEAKSEKSEEGENLKSPLRRDYLRDPGKFYKSFLKDVPDELSQTVTQPTFDEKISFIPVEDVLKFAAKKVDDVLNKIAEQMTFDNNAVGSEVRIIRHFDSYPTFSSKKYYKVVEKDIMIQPPTGGPKKNNYKLLDNNGEENLVGKNDTEFKETAGKNIASKLRDSKDATVEILRLLLQYGSMRLVYKKTVYFLQNGEWIRRDVGNPVFKDKKTGNIILPYTSKDKNSKYKDLDSVPMRWEWFSMKKNVDNVNEILIDKISDVANERGFKLPSAYFDDNNKPLYKKVGAPSKYKQGAMNYVNGIKNKLEKYFGAEGSDIPTIRKNRDELSTLINNYTQSTDARDKGLAESAIRKAVRKTLLKETKK